MFDQSFRFGIHIDRGTCFIRHERPLVGLTRNTLFVMVTHL